MSASRHIERHLIERVGWLRASVLGANDGIVSTASLIVGVAAAEAGRSGILVAGVAGLVAGAMSMAAGEYVSVSSQSDAETADIDRERGELASSPEAELRELSGLYVARGLTNELADQVARQLTATDALAAHVRDELGISALTAARPIQAAFASATAFSIGAAVPLIVAVLAPVSMTMASVTAAAVVSLALLGGLGAKAGGAGMLKPVLRVTLWGVLAMAITAGIGRLFGAVV
ncbi:VIT family protein [Brevundimonas sp.]|uniref:VIT1/CCC1 transporter family protein n=1 Tax=Brevundimonas sp. TaxID=1871086 RepID=UPI001A2AC211|nr:VIT family protein [Brevundimonas sp.]MBJ7484952.1 VIT family protein [Brevundimonas sp.]